METWFRLRIAKNEVVNKMSKQAANRCYNKRYWLA